MLSPKRTTYRKAHKGRIHGLAKGGTALNFCTFGLKAMAPKPTKISDIRGKTRDELTSSLLDLRKEQFNLRFQRATGQTEGIGRVKQVRRDIARVKTILSEQQRSATKS